MSEVSRAMQRAPDTRAGPSPSMITSESALLSMDHVLSPHPYVLSLVGAYQKQGPELMVSICHTGLKSPPAPSSTKILQNQRDLEKTGCCARRGWTFISQILPAQLLMILSWIKGQCLPFRDSIEGLWDHLIGIQQQLEDKEQALAILQETVKVWSYWAFLASWRF